MHCGHCVIPRVQHRSPTSCTSGDLLKRSVIPEKSNGPWYLGPRAALDIEDRAAPAFAADQPISLSRVSEAERSAADLASSHRDIAARAPRCPSGNELGSNLLELGGSVLRSIIRHQSGILITIFPNC